MKIFKTHLLIIGSLFLIVACIAPPTESPIPSISSAKKNTPHKTLVVMLPGRGDRADVFLRENFNLQGEKHGFDTIMVDAHFGYYMKRSLIPALHEDVITPARESGYSEIWLLGVSMGGLGSLLYTTEHPKQVDGLILLAPFLGDDKVIDEIKVAGGLSQWTAENSDLKDYEIAVWAWLKNNTSAERPTPIMLGYGTSDRMASAYPLISEELESMNVYSVQGDHDWVTWQALWNEMAARIVE